MNKLKITSDSLRKKLQELGLLDDDGCYRWDYDNNDNAYYEDEIRISTDVNVDKNGIGYFERLGDTLNCIDDEETILNQVKRLELSKKENENANE